MHLHGDMDNSKHRPGDEQALTTSGPVQVDNVQKSAILSEIEVQKEEFMASVQPGDTVNGTVHKLTDFGAFVYLQSLDGQMHGVEVLLPPDSDLFVTVTSLWEGCLGWQCTRVSAVMEPQWRSMMWRCSPCQGK